MGNVPDRPKSYREIALAQKVAWATSRKLNARAIECAGKYLNLNEQELELISDYENATDLPAGEYREKRQRDAWQGVIFYLRSVARKEKEKEDAA